MSSGRMQTWSRAHMQRLAQRRFFFSFFLFWTLCPCMQSYVSFSHVPCIFGVHRALRQAAKYFYGCTAVHTHMDIYLLDLNDVPSPWCMCININDSTDNNDFYLSSCITYTYAQSINKHLLNRHTILRDVIVWKWMANGKYSVASAYKC
jgi:hypothetical protein